MSALESYGLAENLEFDESAHRKEMISLMEDTIQSLNKKIEQLLKLPGNSDVCKEILQLQDQIIHCQITVLIYQTEGKADELPEFRQLEGYQEGLHFAIRAMTKLKSIQENN